MKRQKIQQWGFIMIKDGALGLRTEQEGYFPKFRGQIILYVLMGPSSVFLPVSKGARSTLAGSYLDKRIFVSTELLQHNKM